MVSRRALLIGGAAAGGALVVGLAWWRDAHLAGERLAALKPGQSQLGTWVRIGADNIVTVVVPHAEMGQGVHTSLPQMLADELDADWALVRMEEAPATTAFANGALTEGFLLGGASIPAFLAGGVDWSMTKMAEFLGIQVTGGSTSVRLTGALGMQVAGAAARAMLLEAAAARWGAPVESLSAAKSRVTHAPTGRSATYGELAAEAAAFTPSSTPKLKDPSAYTLIGTPVPRIDIPSKVNGTATYGIDVRLPGMLYAAAVTAPVFGASIASVDDAAAKAMPGVKAVVRIEAGSVPGPLGDESPTEAAMVVVADSFWRAKKAADALGVTYATGGREAIDSGTIFADHDRALDGETSADAESGDAAAALPQAARPVEARYRVPYLAHAPMEPMNCTAQFKDGKLHLWIGTQDGLGTRRDAAAIAGLSPDDVIVANFQLGGGFGRRLASYANHIAQAIAAARAVEAPVKLVWTREQDLQHDYYRPAVTSRFKAGLDANGAPLAWTNVYTGKNEPAEAAHIPYAIPNQSIRYAAQPTHVPFGPWRSVAHSQHGFFVESFADELAHAAGKDPLQFRLDLLKDQPRHAAALRLAAEKAGWGSPLPAGRGRGVALVTSFGTIVGQIAEVEVDGDGAVRVHRMVCAVDCGRTVNPDGARAQIEGGMIFGLAAALYGKISIAGGAVEQSNFTDYPLLPLAEAPAIEAHFIESGAALGGLGEPGVPPVAAAVANAIFAATGVRVRELPFSGQNLRAPADGRQLSAR